VAVSSASVSMPPYIVVTIFVIASFSMSATRPSCIPRTIEAGTHRAFSHELCKESSGSHLHRGNCPSDVMV